MAEIEGFDLNEVPDSAFDGELIPSGDYPMQVIEAKVKREMGREMIKLTYRIIDGQFTNRLVWGNYNTKHPSPKAQEIARQNIKSLCKAIGHEGPFTDTDVLIDKPFIGRIGLSKPQEGYDQQNEVKGWKPWPVAAPPQRVALQQTYQTQAAPAAAAVNQRAAPQPTAYQPSSPPAAAGGGGTMPWDRARR